MCGKWSRTKLSSCMKAIILCTMPLFNKVWRISANLVMFLSRVHVKQHNNPLSGCLNMCVHANQ